MINPLTVLIADDSLLMRERLAELIAELDDVELVAQAQDGDEAISMAIQHRPDIVILDIRMPEGGGLRALEAIKRQTSAQAIVLTAFDYPLYRRACLKKGADHFVVKSTEFARIGEILLAQSASRVRQ
jgi:DNA-binding NarL/FixJ family response regulator